MDGSVWGMGPSRLLSASLKFKPPVEYYRICISSINQMIFISTFEKM